MLLRKIIGRTSSKRNSSKMSSQKLSMFSVKLQCSLSRSNAKISTRMHWLRTFSCSSRSM
ncbi:unnamed protein product [Oikopleura dioica]|uniref:Uncharacterized protein n=1 Tax=Oikopleura dioica TaxID=34765 RepID=E4Y0P2_OIKDI|nr:unnamed protein product [Oikopleura dioica]